MSESPPEDATEKIPNTSNENSKEFSNALSKEDVQKSSPKKKFSNTVFAIKMRNKKREEKLKNINGQEALSTCKQVFVDVTRLSPKAVPKLISTVENKNKRKKRFQWKLGKTSKKKKARDKILNLNNTDKVDHAISDISEKCSIDANSVEMHDDEAVKQNSETDEKSANVEENKKINEVVVDTQKNNEKNETVLSAAKDSKTSTIDFNERNEDKEEEKDINKEKNVESELKSAANNKNVLQRRKSSRLVTPSTLIDEKWDVEVKSDGNPVPEETFSSKRTEPFIGKLNTKEARILYIEKILKSENILDGQNNSEVSNSKEDLPVGEDKKTSTDKLSNCTNNDIEENSVNKNNLRSESGKNDESHKEEELHTGQKNTRMNKTHQNYIRTRRSKDKAALKSLDLVDQESKNNSKKVIETKDVAKDDEISCRRTIPFIGKTPRKSPPGVPDRPIEIDCSNNDSISLIESVNKKLPSLHSEVNLISDSTNNESVSQNEKEKADYSFNVTDSKLISSKDKNEKSSSSISVNKILNSSSDDKKLKLVSALKAQSDENADISMKDASDILQSSAIDQIRSNNIVKNISNVNVPCSSSSSSKKEEVSTSPKSHNEVLNNVSDVSSDNNDSSCQRTQPFAGKCSRTVPYNRSEKVKCPNTSENSADSINVTKQLETETNSIIITNEIDQISQESSNAIEDIPVNKENEEIQFVTDTSINENSTPSPLVQNGEWKFKRKRSKTDTENDTQREELSSAKKLKAKGPYHMKVSANKSLSTTAMSPGKTICSLFSLNCKKHDHYHEQNSISLTNFSLKNDAYVLLERLELMTDPLVLNYLMKTDRINKIKEDLSLKKNEINVDESDKSLDCKNQIQVAIHSNDKECQAKEDASESNEEEKLIKTNAKDNSILAAESISMINSSKASMSEAKAKMRQRRFSSRSSTESPSLLYKRKKRSVNYIEYSDSDSEESSSTNSSLLKTRSQSRGPMLRSHSKLANFYALDDDYDNREEEDLSQTSCRRNSRNNSYLDATNCAPPSLRTRSRSRAAVAYDSNKTNNQPLALNAVEMSPKTKAKTPITSANSINHQKELQSIQNFLNQQQKENVEEEAELDKEMEDISRNHPSSSSKSCSRGPVLEASKTPNLEQESRSDEIINSNSIETSNISQVNGLQTPDRPVRVDRLLATPKTISSKSKTTPHSGRESKLKDLLITPKKTPSTSSQSQRQVLSTPTSKKLNSLESVLNGVIEIKSPRKDSVRTNLFNKPKSNTDESDKIDTTKLKDLKVQLIKLETVCSNGFKDYSASEIEVLTNKYIDLLMNSNFSCNTWRTPINYHRVTGNRIEEIDNSDCISDTETQMDNENVEYVEEIENIISTPDIIPVIEKYVTSAESEKGSPEKSGPRLQTCSASLESAIATLASSESQHQRNMISEDSNIAEDGSRNENDIDEFNKEPITTAIENAGAACSVQPQTVLVNGTTMLICSLCNKMFVSQHMLDHHFKVDHATVSNTSDSTAPTNATTANLNESQVNDNASEPPAGKKQQSKNKRKVKSASDSLQCAICSVLFDTKELLFEHIITHNEQELQEAYKIAVAKNKETEVELTKAINEGGGGKAKKNAKRKSTDSNVCSSRSSIEEDGTGTNGNDSTLVGITSGYPLDHQPMSHVAVGNDTSSPIKICSCHAYETTAEDLQIEMILFCKMCNVVYRRRECFEVHFRTNIECRRKRTNNEITKVPKLFCSGCPCLLDSLLEMRAHLEMHAKKNSQGTVTFICNICKVAFFGVGGIFYTHWFNHTKAPNFLASRYSFPKLSVVSVLEDSCINMTTTKSQEGFFYIAEHVCRQCRLPFSSEPELQKHNMHPCQPQQPVVQRPEIPENNRSQMIKLICDLCKKFYINKDDFDRHCLERNHLKTPIAKFSRLPITASEQAFVCSLCRAVSKSLDEMKEHWKHVHSPIMELYTCKTCNIVPSHDIANYTYENFERHCRVAHKSEVITCLVYFVTARYVCNICKFGFENWKSMKDHESMHLRSEQTQPPISMGPVLPPVILNESPHTPVQPQTTTLWVADKQVAPDGGRQVHPVYVHYPGINNVQLQPNTVEQNPQIQQEQAIQIRSQTQNLGTNTVGNSTQDSQVPVNQSSLQANNSILQGMLNSTTINQQPHDPPNVETIFLDSRSNSPASDTPTLIPTASSSTTLKDNSGSSSTRSYMTMVNPDFENILTNKGNSSASKSTPGNEISNDTASADSFTPEPFEVVLLNDDLSDNSNSESTPPMEKTATSRIDESPSNQDKNQPQQKTETGGNSVPKPFLRVRSMAELQGEKLHLCSMCGLSFHSLTTYNQHIAMEHSQADIQQNEIGRTTPVQMISPMVSQAKKSSMSEPQSMLVSQMRHKLAVLTTHSNELNNVHRPELQSKSPQYQQQQPYLFASCSSANNSGSTSTNKSSPLLRANILRRSQGTAASNVDGNYSVQRGPPPPYPSSSNAPVSNRPGAIQLPERNIIVGGTPATKRPSGAATRIPQQSLSSYEDLTDRRQSVIRMPLNPVDDVNSNPSTTTPRVLPSLRALPQHQSTNQVQEKIYSRNSNDIQYSGSVANMPSLLNYLQRQPQQQMQQQPRQQQFHQQSVKHIYSCNRCAFRAENLAALRAHEIVHFTANINQVNQLPQQQHLRQNQQQQSQQQQQQRFGAKHVSVNTMPERPRTAIANVRQASDNPEKRYTCRICHQSLTTDSALVEHVTRFHSDSSPGPSPGLTSRVRCYVCDYCPHRPLFESEAFLREHMDDQHNHSCRLCQKRYPSLQDLLTHMEVHNLNT